MIDWSLVNLYPLHFDEKSDENLSAAVYIQCRGVLVAQWLGRRTSDPAVLGSIPRPRVIRLLDQLSLPSLHPSGVGKSSASLYRLGLRRGVFTCVGWQVTLCDPIWQATPCSSEMDYH